MMIDYEGRLFQRAGGGDGTVARYRQDGDLVWADFTGGKVRRGTITGICGPDGTLRLREEWERFGAHAGTGVSYLEEVRPAGAR